MTTEQIGPSAACPAEETARDYVAGLLEEGEAEAFEEHYFGCDRCHAEVQRALELRSALTEQDGGRWADERKSGRRFGGTWTMLAAAGLAALLIGGAIWLSRLGGSGGAGEMVLRGEVAELKVEVAARRDGFELRWPVQEGVDHYRVELFSPTGELYEERETQDARMSLNVSPRVGESLDTAGEFVVRVEGLDRLRRIVIRSRLMPVALETP